MQLPWMTPLFWWGLTYDYRHEYIAIDQ